MSAGTEMRSMCKREIQIAKIFITILVKIYRMFFDLSKKILKVTLPLFHQNHQAPTLRLVSMSPTNKLTVARPCQRATGEDLSMGTRGIGNARAGATGTGLSMSSRAASTTAAVRPSLRRFRSVRRSGSSLPVV